jgi:hypothetical protein
LVEKDQNPKPDDWADASGIVGRFDAAGEKDRVVSNEAAGDNDITGPYELGNCLWELALALTVEKEEDTLVRGKIEIFGF